MAWSETTGLWLKQIIDFTAVDKQLSELHSKCVTSYSIKNGLIFWKGRMIIPSNDQLKNRILNEFHNKKVGGHARVTKTIAKNFFGL